MPKPFPVSMQERLAATLQALKHWTDAAESINVTVPVLTVEFREEGTPANGDTPAALGAVIASLEFERDSATGEYGFRVV